MDEKVAFPVNHGGDQKHKVLRCDDEVEEHIGYRDTDAIGAASHYMQLRDEGGRAGYDEQTIWWEGQRPVIGSDAVCTHKRMRRSSVSISTRWLINLQ